MGHLVQAARQLMAEVADFGGEVEILDEEDGLGFNRSIRLDKTLVGNLPDEEVEALLSDPRVEDVVKSSKGVRVTFVADTRADSAAPFGLTSTADQG